MAPLTKILHVNNFLDGGGAETVFRSSALAVSKHLHGYEHTLAFGGNESSEYSFFNEQYKCCVLQSQAGTFKETGKYFYNESNKKTLLKFILGEKPDIIHLHNFLSLSPSVLGAIAEARKVLNTAVVHTVHGFDLVCPNSVAYDYSLQTPCLACVGQTVKRDIFVKSCDKRGYKYSVLKGSRAFFMNQILKYRELIDYFVTPSHFVKSLLIKDGIASEKISVVRNPMKLKSDHTSTEKREDTIVYFGRFALEKNVTILLQAFLEISHEARAPGLGLWLIGEGEEKSKYEEFVQRHSLQNKVKILPFMSQDKLNKCLFRAKISVVPSRVFETFGMASVESVLAGLWPIVPGHGALEETVRWLECGSTFKSESVSELKEAICVSLENYDNCQKIIESAKQKIQSECSYQSYASQMEKIYISVGK